MEGVEAGEGVEWVGMWWMDGLRNVEERRERKKSSRV